MRRLRRPGADVVAQQLTDHNLAEVKALLSNCGIRHDVHEGHLLLYGEHGEPRSWPPGSWLVFGSDRWDIYTDAVIRAWERAA